MDSLQDRVPGLATERLVWTYGSPWPLGVVTGYEDNGAFVVEHVIAFRPGRLIPMLRAAQGIARARGYDHVRFRVPRAFPLSRQLRIIAGRLGCRVYYEDAEWVDLAWWP